MPVYNAALHSVDEKETRRYAGLARSENFPASMITEACLEAQIAAKPQGIYEIYPYECQQAVILGDRPLTLTGGVIQKHLAGAQQVAVLAVTIGGKLEELIQAHFAAGRYTAALLLDAAGTTAVEMVADQLNALIDEQAARLGCRTTSRFSPGYGNWAITSQAAVTALAGGKTIGITVTETSMLEPRKSVTAVIGLIPKDKQTQTPAVTTGCNTCTQPNCPAKRV